MRTLALSWRQPAMFCASSLENRCWEFRSFDLDKYTYEQDNLAWSCRIRSESGDDLGGNAALFSRGSASTRRGGAISELRGAGARAPRPTRRSCAADRYRVEHKPCLSTGR